MIANLDRDERGQHRPRPLTSTARAFPGRDDAALETFLGTVAPRLLAYALRRVQPSEDAADVVAQVLLTAWRRRDDLPQDNDAAAAWLFGVARNVLANHRRGQVRREALADRLRDDLTRAERSSASHAGHASADGPAERVREALELLPEDDRELLTLVAWDGLGIAEAGAVLGLGASSARSRWARAKQRFAAALETLG
ncbi:RNA polymerase, sigma subunit, ECF family [Quadrisphaera granulorum]|uniref:RNA polymerase ECF family sigma subunit n=1 Tax=Quadrisphaera granulorum TaxID=317664 RepID=A0A315ZHY7_9ACTN|nr:RNA polymerase sigma factor [Quadrisphaera granulorum]PWJ45151.1 RNA polymerase ECF family sigma subunit [Quadrisphaera granulorum]SZE99194.1 RNA polymerase, sigma subunit, ECF family [Quadrisphaera granulorum]